MADAILSESKYSVAIGRAVCASSNAQNMKAAIRTTHGTTVFGERVAETVQTRRIRASLIRLFQSSLKMLFG